jgi:hypothetical protein
MLAGREAMGVVSGVGLAPFRVGALGAGNGGKMLIVWCCIANRADPFNGSVVILASDYRRRTNLPRPAGREIVTHCY